MTGEEHARAEMMEGSCVSLDGSGSEALLSVEELASRLPDLPSKGQALGRLTAVLCAFLIGGCGIDIGANDDAFGTRVLNNTASAVVIGDCTKIYCTSVGTPETIKPGKSVSVIQDPDGVRRPMGVLSTSKQILGCLPFQFRKVPPHTVVTTISQMVPCTANDGPGSSAGQDWPGGY